MRVIAQVKSTSGYNTLIASQVPLHYNIDTLAAAIHSNEGASHKRIVRTKMYRHFVELNVNCS